ncbi:MAG: hypothetical protein FD146_205 [Anaerolineaceae bacterium]|nr:MAG: hypothetical protein FD146_205 [Anaerolineaceae bacterium]
MRPAFRVLLSAFCILLFSSCASPADREPAAPQLVFLNLGSSGQAQLVSQTDLHSPFTILQYSIPSDCSVYNLYPNPVHSLLAAELLCNDQARVEIYDLQTGQTYLPVEQTDSRFLAWTADGSQAYLKTDTLGSPQVVHIAVPGGKPEALPFPATLYDLATLPDGRVVYSLTRGIGYGSETWLAEADGKPIRQLLAEPYAIIAYLRPSPDGSRIAFILFPDSQAPFPNGELWVMNADGADPRRLAAADAGHGFAPAWSPGGTQIAFVVRANADDERVQQSAAALVSNVYRIEVQGGTLTAVTAFTDAIAGSPTWSPDGTMLAFNVVRDGKMQAWVTSLTDAAPAPLGEEFSCCAVWLPGR